MATITASGALQSLVQQLMLSERLPAQRLAIQKSGLEARLKVYQDLGSRLSDLQRRARSFTATGSQSPLRLLQAVGVDESKVHISATGAAAPGAHTVRIDQLATQHSLASVVVAESDQGLLSAVNALTGPVRFRISAGGTETEIDFVLPSGSSETLTTSPAKTLDAVAAAINEAQDQVDAFVVLVKPGESRLLLKSRVSGSAGRITAIEDLSGGLMSLLGLSGVESPGIGSSTAGQSTPTSLPATLQEGLDAKLLIDGLPVTATGNTISDLFPGVSLTLRSASPLEQTFRIEHDQDGVVLRVEEFLKSFNETLDELRNQTRPSDAQGFNRGPLAGEIVLKRLRAGLREALTRPAGPAESLGTTMAQFGITSDREGHLTLSDAAAFRRAVAEDSGALQAHWGGQGGIAGRLSDLLDSFARSGGILSSQEKSMRSRMTYLDGRIRDAERGLARREEILLNQLAKIQASVSLLTRQQEFFGGLVASSDRLFS